MSASDTHKYDPMVWAGHKDTRSRAREIHRFSSAWRTEFGRTPTFEEIAAEFADFDLSDDEIAKIVHGRYANVFLDAIVGKGRYKLLPYKLRALTDEKSGAYEQLMEHLEDPKLSFAYVSDTKVTLLWLHDYPGWMAFCKPLGIRITPSGKIAKRVTVFTRLGYLWHKAEPGELVIECVEFDDHPELAGLPQKYRDRFLDGANVISRQLLDKMIDNGSAQVDNPYDKAAINRRIDEAGSFSLRILTPDGLIKGDALCVDREQLATPERPEGADVLYYKENLKTEVRTEFVFVLAEPLSEPEQVWTDDQTLSWLGPWLFPQPELEAALEDLCDRTVAQLARGEYPDFFTYTAKLDNGTTIDHFQRQALQWETSGLPLSQSIFLTDRVATGFLNRLASTEEREDSSAVTVAKRRWPVPCAWYAHVATDSWLHMAGYNFEPTPQGSVWYHTASKRIIYNDFDFADLYSRHGGWDLDDSVRAIYRTMNGAKKIVIVRSPNSFGEYDVKDYIEGTPRPTWERSDGTIVEFPEITSGVDAPPYLEQLDISYAGLPQHKADPWPTYSIDFVREAIATALMSQGVFGRRANADMVYFATIGDYRREQLCSIEDTIDACTQEPTPEALEAIDAETKKVLNEVATSGKAIDRTLWRRRIGEADIRARYTYGLWTDLANTHDGYVARYGRMLKEVGQKVVEHVSPLIFDLGVAQADKGAEFVKWYYELTGKPWRTVRRRTGVEETETASEFFDRVNDRMMSKLLQMRPVLRHDVVLAMARHCYLGPRPGGAFADSAVFLAASEPAVPSVFNAYREAIAFYGIAEATFSRSGTCPSCRQAVTVTDRLDYQALHNTGKCAGCRS